MHINPHPLPGADADYPGPATVLAERIEGITVAMLTTISDDSRLHGRPMLTHSTPGENGLWFLASAASPAALDIMRRPAVNLSYVDSSQQRYISVAGTALLIRDTDRIRRMWSPATAVWFPKGIDDPDLTLIKVEAEEADYWDDSKGAFVRLTGFIREILGEKPVGMVDRGHLEVRSP